MTKIDVPAELAAEMEKTAKAEGRNLADVIADAWRRYNEDRKWRDTVEFGTRHAKAKGLTEADVDRAIHEVHAEQSTRGR